MKYNYLKCEKRDNTNKTESNNALNKKIEWTPLYQLSTQPCFLLLTLDMKQIADTFHTYSIAR